MPVFRHSFASHRALVLHLAREDLWDRHSGSLLGVAWTFLSPLLQICIFVLVFSQIMGVRLDSMGLGSDLSQFAYSIYLILGLLPWLLFSRSLDRITPIFIQQRLLLSKVPVGFAWLPVAVLLSEGGVFIISWGFFLVFLLWSGLVPSASWGWLLLLLVLQLFLVYSLGLLLAVCTAFVRDIKEMVSVLLQLGFWATPIVYVVDILPDWLIPFMVWNPMFVLVDSYRRVVMLSLAPDFALLLSLFFASLLLCLFAGLLLYRVEKDLRDVL